VTDVRCVQMDFVVVAHWYAPPRSNSKAAWQKGKPDGFALSPYVPSRTVIVGMSKLDREASAKWLQSSPDATKRDAQSERRSIASVLKALHKKIARTEDVCRGKLTHQGNDVSE
jgi:hypothetical protein